VMVRSEHVYVMQLSTPASCKPSLLDLTERTWLLHILEVCHTLE
jgi:hypothetical protein